MAMQLSGSINISGSLNVSGGITGPFNATNNVVSSSAQISNLLPANIISGSSQLTSSYDERYTLSGSVQPLPNGLISGSSQLTSSYDNRYALSGAVDLTQIQNLALAYAIIL